MEAARAQRGAHGVGCLVRPVGRHLQHDVYGAGTGRRGAHKRGRRDGDDRRSRGPPGGDGRRRSSIARRRCRRADATSLRIRGQRSSGPLRHRPGHDRRRHVDVRRLLRRWKCSHRPRVAGLDAERRPRLRGDRARLPAAARGHDPPAVAVLKRSPIPPGAVHLRRGVPGVPDGATRLVLGSERGIRRAGHRVRRCADGADPDNVFAAGGC